MLLFQAKTSGKFSREELEKLRRELQHHKEKVHEYHALLETLGRAEGGPGMFQNGAGRGCCATPSGLPVSEQEPLRLGPVIGQTGSAVTRAASPVAAGVAPKGWRSRGPPGRQQGGGVGRSVPEPAPHRPPAWAPAESHENAIGPVDLSGVQAEALASRHAELKDRLRNIDQGFDRLRRVSHQGYGAETGESPPGPRPPPAGVLPAAPGDRTGRLGTGRAAHMLPAFSGAGGK